MVVEVPVVTRKAHVVYVTKKMDVPVRMGQMASSAWMAFGKKKTEKAMITRVSDLVAVEIQIPI